ncbi:unnamed protein product [Chrysoparadoxa australica]
MEQGRRASHHMWNLKVFDDQEVAEGSSSSDADADADVDTDADADQADADQADADHADADGGDEKEDEHKKIHKAVSQFEASGSGRLSESLFPFGIYTIPEISMVGKTEQQLTEEGISYEVGVANYQELAKGQMLGGVDGFLKLIFHTETRKLLGVHCYGEGATEIVHIGQVVISQGGCIDYFNTAVFNYPTLAEAYNVAAQDGLRKLSGTDVY